MATAHETILAHEIVTPICPCGYQLEPPSRHDTRDRTALVAVVCGGCGRQVLAQFERSMPIGFGF